MVLPGAGRGAGPVQPGQHRPVGAGSPVLVRGFGGNRTTALLLLVFTLLLWGVTPWRWSGFLSANSFGFGLPYPSAFATAAAWACIGQWTALPRRRAATITGCRDWPRSAGGPYAPVYRSLARHCTRLRAGGPALLDEGPDAVDPGRSRRGSGDGPGLAWPYYDVLGLLAGSSAFTDVHQLLYGNAPERLVLLTSHAAGPARSFPARSA